MDEFFSVKQCIACGKHYELVLLSLIQVTKADRLSNQVDDMVVVSQYPDSNEEAYGYRTVGYFKKTDGCEILAEKLCKVNDEYLMRVREFGGFRSSIRNIRYVEFVKRRVTVYCADGLESVLQTRSLKDAAVEFEELVQVSRTCLVNPSHVWKVRNDVVILFGGKQIKYSRKGLKKLRGALSTRLS